MLRDLVSGGAMGVKNTHFRSQKQVRHYKSSCHQRVNKNKRRGDRGRGK